MQLILFPETLALCKLSEQASLFDWSSEDANLHVVIKDPHGKSVICSDFFAGQRPSDIIDKSLWRFFQIDEIFDVDTIGVVAAFSRILAERDMSVFVISSYETDYLLVQPHRVQDAVQAFQDEGHAVSIVETGDSH